LDPHHRRAEGPQPPIHDVRRCKVIGGKQNRALYGPASAKDQR
jgi:hypothetical protein